MAWPLALILIGDVHGKDASAGDQQNASAADDRKIVAALDADYQAALRRNDAATIARVLADDFVVTGTGKILN